MSDQSDPKHQPTGNHVFISYSREDQTYARSLVEDLHRHGFEVWIDDRIDFGDRWWQTIVKAIRSCAAFIVIMTPDSEESKWVEREIFLAEREKKPIFPLLLRGKENPLFTTTHYVDVTNSQIPPKRFYQRLGRVVPLKPMTEDEQEISITDSISQVPPEGLIRKPPTNRLLRRRQKIERPKQESPVYSFEGVFDYTRKLAEADMVKIPAGEFLMGSDPNVDKNAEKNEQPQHTVHLPDFYIAKTPVTNSQYAAFVEAAGHQPPIAWKNEQPPSGTLHHPVSTVSWHDAVTYCKWLSEAKDLTFRLPTEAEWEKAARGTEGLIYPWGNQWDTKRCNTNEGDKRYTTPVGAYSDGASPYGVLDMAGNVWEWTQSLWGKEIEEPDFNYPYNSEDGRENLKAGNEFRRVLRGGSFSFNRYFVRCAFRIRVSPYDRHGFYGFRVLVSPSSPPSAL